MEFTAAIIVPSTDASRYAWAGLARFQNVAFVEEEICRLHFLGKADRQNARKQATQIRYSLIQAKEYYDAAAAVTLVRKPSLLYYAIMSLAVAEILFKQTGASSLDAARAQHRHHGLILRVANAPPNADLKTASTALVAQPLIRANGERAGTFELWHRSCRETPLCGTITTFQEGVGRENFNLILSATDARLPLLPEKGLSLLECLRASPGMMNWLPSFGIDSPLVRGKLTSSFSVPLVEPLNWSGEVELIIHPDNDLIQSFLENVRARSTAIPRFNFVALPQGGIITIRTDASIAPADFHIPNGSVWRRSELRLWPNQQPLNEFGYLYVGLYITGNYARYYPDRWLRDVEQNSPLAIAVQELMYIVEQRIALLSYAEFVRVYQVIDD
jgi:hypothetical protein